MIINPAVGEVVSGVGFPGLPWASPGPSPGPSLGPSLDPSLGLRSPIGGSRLKRSGLPQIAVQCSVRCWSLEFTILVVQDSNKASASGFRLRVSGFRLQAVGCRIADQSPLPLPLPLRTPLDGLLFVSASFPLETFSPLLAPRLFAAGGLHLRQLSTAEKL